MIVDLGCTLINYHLAYAVIKYHMTEISSSQSNYLIETQMEVLGEREIPWEHKSQIIKM